MNQGYQERKKKRAYLFLAGSHGEETSHILSSLSFDQEREGIFAIDGGYLQLTGKVPYINALIGDFDSLFEEKEELNQLRKFLQKREKASCILEPQKILEEEEELWKLFANLYPRIQEEVQKIYLLPVHKDDTDTVYALRLLKAEGWKTCYLYGGLGGKRFDHSLANLQSLYAFKKQGGEAYLISENEVLGFLKAGEILHVQALGSKQNLLEEEQIEQQKMRQQKVVQEQKDFQLGKQEEKAFPPKKGRGLSLFAFDGKVEGLMVQGTTYAGTDLSLNTDFPLGVSNSLQDEEAKITCKKGYILFVIEKAPHEKIDELYWISSNRE